MLRAALYIRVSTDEQALNGDSIITQKDALTLYAKNNNMTIVDYYIDDGYTATNLKRPNLQRLLTDINNKLVDIVLFTKIDRWSRGVRNYYRIQDTLDKNKVHWKTIFEDYDTSTASGRLHINIMLSVAENESAQTSERIRAVFKNKYAKGEVCTGNVAKGYRIENKKLVIDPIAAEMVRDIFNQYEKIVSIRKVLAYVKENYEHIYYNPLRNILSNTLYIGIHPNGTKNYCPPIISTEQFYNVQRLLKRNQKVYVQQGEKSSYIFAGVLKCKFCNCTLVGNRLKKYNKTVGTYIYKVYKCQNNYRNHLCSNKYHIPETNILEKYLINNIKTLLSDYIATISKEKTQNKKGENSKQIKNIKRRMDKLKELYLEDLIDKEIYKSDYEDLKLQLDKITSSQTKKDTSNLSVLQDFLKLDIDSIYKTLNDTEKRQLWLSIIDYISIGDNRNDIEVHFL